MVTLSEFLPAPGVYRVTGLVWVADGTTSTMVTIVGPPFVYHGVGTAASPLPQLGPPVP